MRNRYLLALRSWRAFAAILVLALASCFGEVSQNDTAGGGSTVTVSVDGGAPRTYTHTPDASVPDFEADPYIGYSYDAARDVHSVFMLVGEDAATQTSSMLLTIRFRGTAPGTYTLSHDTGSQAEFSFSNGTWFRAAKVSQPSTSGSVTITQLASNSSVAGTYEATVGDPVIGLQTISGSFSVQALALPDSGGSQAPSGSPQLQSPPSASPSEVNSGDTFQFNVSSADVDYAYWYRVDRPFATYKWTTTTPAAGSSQVQVASFTPSGVYYPLFILRDDALGLWVNYTYEWSVSPDTYTWVVFDDANTISVREPSDIAIPFVTVTCPGTPYYVYTYSTGTAMIDTLPSIYDASETEFPLNHDWRSIDSNGISVTFADEVVCLSPGTYYIKVWPAVVGQSQSGSYSLLVSKTLMEYDGRAMGAAPSDNDPADDNPPSLSGTPNVISLETAQTHTLDTATDQADWFMLTVP